MKKVKFTVAMLGLLVTAEKSWAIGVGIGAVDNVGGICTFGVLECAAGIAILPFACAPEVAEGNLKATDRVVSTLARSPEFKNAKKFKGEIKRIAALPSGERIAEYFKTIGIDPKNKDEVIEFVGAREAQDKHVTALQRNLDLSSAQAEKVIGVLSNSLIGNLQ